MEIKEPYSSEEYSQYYQSRWEILRKPWNQPKGSEIDNLENISLHAMVVDGKEIAGVGRLTYFQNGEGQIRFMGVVEKHRKNGVGKMLLDFLEGEAKKMGLEKIFLNSRDEALFFYSKCGYKAEGKPFTGFAGILHTRMVKTL